MHLKMLLQFMVFFQVFVEIMVLKTMMCIGISHLKRGPEAGLWLEKAAKISVLNVYELMSVMDAQPYIFCYLEETSYLKINDELHMFAIEYV